MKLNLIGFSPGAQQVLLALFADLLRFAVDKQRFMQAAAALHAECTESDGKLTIKGTGQTAEVTGRKECQCEFSLPLEGDDVVLGPDAISFHGATTASIVIVDSGDYLLHAIFKGLGLDHENVVERELPERFFQMPTPPWVSQVGFYWVTRAEAVQLAEQFRETLLGTVNELRENADSLAA